MEDVRLPKGHLSVSQVRTYQNCPYMYDIQVVQGIRSTGGYSMLDGRAFGAAMEVSLKNKMETGEILEVEEVKQAYADAFDHEIVVKADDYDFKEDHDKGLKEGDVKDTGLKAVDKYYSEVGINLKPHAVELGITTDIAGIPFKTRIDLIETDKSIRDFKKTKKSYPEGIIHTTIQLPAYAVAFRDLYGEAESMIGLDVVVDLKGGPKIQRLELEGAVPDERIDRLSNTVAQVARGISAGIFPRNEEGMACSWCSYKSLCKAKK